MTEHLELKIPPTNQSLILAGEPGGSRGAPKGVPTGVPDSFLGQASRLVAGGAALKRVTISTPIVLRLDGTNAVEGRAILAPHLNEALITEPTMLDAARRAVSLANA